MGANPNELERVRSELRRLGYLHHGLERFLLQDALKPRRPGRTLPLLALKVGVFAGVVGALVLAFALAVVNGNVEASPLDLIPLFLHLFFPIALGSGVAFLALSGLLVALHRFTHVRRMEAWILAAALAVGAVLLAAAVAKVPALVAEGHPWHLAVLAVATPLVVVALVRAVYAGLLSLAISLSSAAPKFSRFDRRWLGAAVLVSALLLLLPALVFARRAAPEAPETIPIAPGEPVLLIGMDGVLPSEIDYLLDRGELPAMGELLADGGRRARYVRPAEPPASFWTSVATGLPSPEHGVSALDAFRPLGVVTALARTGPLRPWWGKVEVPLGLAEHRALLANRRRAFTFWELASRGGMPVVVVNWWGTYPVRPTPGLLIAHGAYQLLTEAAPGAVAPAAQRRSLEALRRRISEAGVGGGERGLPAAVAGALADRALLPERFYRAAFEKAVVEEVRRPRAAALYLPALDIAADGFRAGSVAFADLVRRELGEADHLLARVAPKFGTVVVVFDPGRRAGRREGRVLLWRREGCRGGAERPEVTPEALASALLRALGLPQSRELPAPPAVCGWPPPLSEVATFGEPLPETAEGVTAREGREYLESLRSLGYL